VRLLLCIGVDTALHALVCVCEAVAVKAVSVEQAPGSRERKLWLLKLKEYE
jgi:hypothetical protein